MARRLKTIEQMTDKDRERLIRDILAAEQDLLALGEQHRLPPDVLAQWIMQPENRQCLLGLCQLADVQTQVLLSRYRMLAASRLIRLATNEDGSIKDDVARRACVDLLRADLKRASDGPDAVAPEDEDEALSALRAMMYGDEQGGQGNDEDKVGGDEELP